VVAAGIKTEDAEANMKAIGRQVAVKREGIDEEQRAAPTGPPLWASSFSGACLCIPTWKNT
jgi:hypothetical protein